MAGTKDPIFGATESQLRGLGGRINDIANRIDGMSSKMLGFVKELGNAGETAAKTSADIGNSMDKISKGTDSAAKSMSKLEKGSRGLLNVFDKLGRSLISLNASIIGLGVGLLITAVQRVYELKERWAEATGLLNMKMGALTPNIKNLTKTANAWRGTMRGLTGDFKLGGAMFTEYAATLETTGKHVQEFNKLGLQLARGFDLGAKGSGNLTKTLRTLGFSAGEATKELAQMIGISGLEGVDVNVQEVMKDLAEAGDFMSEFGRSGQKALIQSTVYLKQFNIGLKDTVRFMDVWDTFDSATEATGRLNTIFGTTISSMDMLLKQDPAERFETVRQELLAQGKTFENLSRFERKTLADTLKIGEQEIAFMLDRKKAGISYADFKAKAAKVEISERDAQKMMQEQMQATVQTLFDFGSAMDKVTTAIANALRPLFEEIGLVEKGSDAWSGFSGIMKGVTATLVKMFNSLAKSDEWKKMMQGLGRSIKGAAKWVANLKSADITGFFDKMISGIRSFVKWSQVLIAFWIGGKVTAMLLNLGRMASTVGGLGAGSVAGSWGGKKLGLGGSGAPSSNIKWGRFKHRVGGAASVAGKGLMGAGIGAGVGQLTGGGTTGGTIGGAAGGALGMVFGPLGSALGGAIGGLVGKELQGIVDYFTTPSAEDIHKAQMVKLEKERVGLLKDLNMEERRRSIQATKYQIVERREAIFRAKDNAKLKDLSDKATKKGVILSGQEAASLRDKINVLGDFGLANKKVTSALDELGAGEGPAKLSGKQLKAIYNASIKYEEKLSELKEATEKATAAALQKIEIEGIGAKRRLKTAEVEEFKLQSDEAKRAEELAKKRFGSEQERHLKDLEFQEDAARYNNTTLKPQRQAELKLYRDLKEQRNRTKIESRSAEKKLKTAQNEEIRLKIGHTKQVIAIERAGLIKRSTEFIEFSQQEKFAGGTEKDILTQFLRKGGAKKQGIGGGLLKAMIETGQVSGAVRKADGGIVTRPTMSLIGERGPEAIIPLSTMARGKGRQPTRFGGGAAKKLVNYASGGSSGDNKAVATVTAGPVYLDGRLVGRHLLNSILENSST